MVDFLANADHDQNVVVLALRHGKHDHVEPEGGQVGKSDG
jgi:hypothetical protein